MQTPTISLQSVGSRRVEVAFDGPRHSHLGGLLALRELADALGLFEQFADCFDDYRDPTRIEHSVRDLVAQRVLGIIAGYEDLDDHDTLRSDPVFALAVGKSDPTGSRRSRGRDQGCALAGHATLGRLETAPASYNPERPDLTLIHHPERLEKLFVDLFLDAYDEPPAEITLDVDATHDEVHGHQEGRFYHGFYRCHCYLPLYVFCGEDLLVAKLRPSNIDGAAGALEEIQRLVAHIRRRWPSVRIRVRGDSGFCRDELLSWCEDNDVDYLVGLARNPRLQRMIAGELDCVCRRTLGSGEPERAFCELWYQTQTSWSRMRRVVAKAEALPGKANPRFVVTSLSEGRPSELYEQDYCARAEMENRIKEQHRGLFADRTSSHTMRANQLRLWFSSLAYVLVNLFRRVALRGTALARAQAWTLRQRLVWASTTLVRRAGRWLLRISASSSYRSLFQTAIDNIHAAYPTVF